MPDSTLVKIAEGREAEMFAWDGRILRLLRQPGDTASLEREAEVLAVARARGVRVPATYGVTVVDGRPGLIMERIGGADLLTEIGRRPWKVFSAGATCGLLHAAVHEVQAPPDIPTLKQRITRLVTTSPHVARDLAEFALARLSELPDGDHLCHGDFHPANVLMDGKDAVVIDWTNVTRGDPTADFVRSALILKIGEPPPGTSPVILVAARFARGILLGRYESGYRRIRPVHPALAARWLPVRAVDRLADGIPEEREKLLRVIDEARQGTSTHI